MHCHSPTQPQRPTPIEPGPYSRYWLRVLTHELRPQFLSRGSDPACMAVCARALWDGWVSRAGLAVMQRGLLARRAAEAAPTAGIMPTVPEDGAAAEAHRGAGRGLVHTYGHGAYRSGGSG